MYILALIAALTPMTAAPSETSFYIGTYTGASGSKGIYRATLDTRSGAISAPTLVAESSNPSYLALSPNHRYLYAVNENDKGSVTSYAVEAKGALRLLGVQPVKESAPCYLSIDPSGRCVLTAGYVGGYVECLPIDTQGAAMAPSSAIHHSGSGPNADRQDASHMHWIQTEPSGRFVYSCDLGTDKVEVYSLNPIHGDLTELSIASAAPPGAGPRHGAFSRDGKFLYVNGEMGNSVIVYAVDATTGSLSQKQSISTLPEGVDQHGKTTSEIQRHNSGRWLYVSNRGDDSISIFSIVADGTLTLVQIKKLDVKFPRGFSLDPSGNWLVAAGQNSNDLEVLSVDQSTGKLNQVGHTVAVGSPVCILFGR